jgi:hypothetical protein
MNFKNLKLAQSLTETRVAPNTTPEFVITPTEGTMRINQPMAELLSVDYWALTSEEGVRLDIIAVGEDFILAVQDSGAKLASPGKKTSGSLVFNHGNTWSRLGGEAGYSTHYTSKDLIVGGDEAGLVTKERALDAGYITEDGEYTQLAEDAEMGTAGEKVQYAVSIDFMKKVENKRKKAGEGEDADEEVEVEDFA